MTNTLTEPSTTTNAYRWYVVLLLTLAYVFSFIDRQILSLLIEEIKADLAISDTQFSLLSGLAFSLFYAIMGLPIAYFADRFSRVRIIASGIAFWSLATVACGLARNFAHMFVARVGVGVGEAALTPATYSMLSDWPFSSAAMSLPSSRARRWWTSACLALFAPGSSRSLSSASLAS